MAVFGAVMLMGLLCAEFVPVASLLQFVKTYCTPVVPGTVPAVMDAVAFVLPSNHPCPLVVP